MFKSKEIKTRNKARKAIMNYMCKHGDIVDAQYGVNGACFFNSFSIAEADAWINQNCERIINNGKDSDELVGLLKDYMKAQANISRQEIRDAYNYGIDL